MRTATFKNGNHVAVLHAVSIVALGQKQRIPFVGVFVSARGEYGAGWLLAQGDGASYSEYTEATVQLFTVLSAPGGFAEGSGVLPAVFGYANTAAVVKVLYEGLMGSPRAGVIFKGCWYLRVQGRSPSAGVISKGRGVHHTYFRGDHTLYIS